jgi:hypothetical protein
MINSFVLIEKWTSPFKLFSAVKVKGLQAQGATVK